MEKVYAYFYWLNVACSLLLVQDHEELGIKWTGYIIHPYVS